MSYLTGHSPLALGVSAADVAAASTAVLTDPCFGELTNEILELQEMMAAKEEAEAKVTGRPVEEEVGVGLCYAIKPVKAFKFHIKNPWFTPVAILALGGLIFWAGMETGKRRRR